MFRAVFKMCLKSYFIILKALPFLTSGGEGVFPPPPPQLDPWSPRLNDALPSGLLGVVLSEHSAGEYLRKIPPSRIFRGPVPRGFVPSTSQNLPALSLYGPGFLLFAGDPGAHVCVF